VFRRGSRRGARRVPLGPVPAVAVFLMLGSGHRGLTEAAGSERCVARLAPATLGKGFGAYHATVGMAALRPGSDSAWFSADFRAPQRCRFRRWNDDQRWRCGWRVLRGTFWESPT
jgi:hypothetical protein